MTIGGVSCIPRRRLLLPLDVLLYCGNCRGRRSGTDRKRRQEPQRVGIVSVVIGLLIGCIPPVIVPAWLNTDLIYGIGNLFLLIGVGMCAPLVKLLSKKPLRVLGKYSFSIIIAHTFVLFTISSALFLCLLEAGVPSGWSTLICILTGIPLNAAAVFITEKAIDAVTGLIISKLFKKKQRDQ